MPLKYCPSSPVTIWHRGTEPKNCFCNKGNLTAGEFFIFLLKFPLMLVSVLDKFSGREFGCVLRVYVVSKREAV